MYTIKRTAELTGVPVATLRAWERRYAVVEPRRTPAGYRLYDESAVRVLATMHALVGDGWSPRQAAEEARRRTGAEPEVMGGEPVPGVRVVAPLTSSRATSAPAGSLVPGAATLDAQAVDSALDAAFARGSFESVVDSWLMPELDALGAAWVAGEVSVAGEHLASHAVLRRLSAAFEAAGHSFDGVRLLVGLPPGARHELGALAFATAARRQGLTVLYLGPDLPVATWIDTVRQQPTAAVVLSVPTPADVDAASRTLQAIRMADPALPLWVGGAAQDLVEGLATPLGHDIAAAARRVAATLTAIPTTPQEQQ